ncbi:MAG: acyl-CoA/acyl-ACP dehydrogenase [Novosphingobium sp.]|nr:acyl-CoA/acyl-ACP dehydrogenase [Novosphingobium sp.]
MSLLYDDAQLAIAAESRRVLEARIAAEGLLPLLERQDRFHEPFWETAKQQGWTALALPEAWDGLNLSLVELGLIAFQAGRTISGAPFLTSSYGAAQALLNYAADDLKNEWLPKFASGDAIGAVAFAEQQDVIPTRSSVTFANGKLDGSKPSVSGGARADIAIVLASEAGKPVLVAAPLEGVVCHVLQTFDNSRCTADLHFARSPAVVLVRGGGALDAALHILAHQAVVTAHEQAGGAEALMERARDYALERKAFGQPIGAFQSVKHRIAELYGLVELARAGALHAASREGKDDFLKAAAAARIQACEAYDTAARDCVQVHGGIGVTWEAGLHLHMRRARTLAVEQGNALFWEDVLVDQLAGAAA